MKKVVFDIETSNIFADVGKADPSLLDISIVGLYDYTTDTYHTFEQSEFKNLWPLLEQADLLIGFNSEHFDLPLLNKYYNGDLYKIPHLDILKEIKESYGRRMKLDQIAEGTLKINKSGHGLEAVTWWRNGEKDKVKKYCLDDVKITKDVFDFAVKNNKLKFKEDGKVIDIPLLNAHKWIESNGANSMTFSLPF
ncbi:MAG TPA: ribonuclease H-like domain-containing protein [Candidatus Nanoarchaeia archaeon]|nr:ribonuclease H-like domain-containing protein [Candidatus Nanoarchaeia archaeon]